MTATPSPKASVVIRAFNEERWLPDVFAALERQSFRDYEVLLVDSGSVDHTRDIAAAHGARIVRLRSEDFTFGYSLNTGIKEALGEIIVILSAHAIPADEKWLEHIVASLQSPDVAMVYGSQRGHEVSLFSEARDLERQFPSYPFEVDPKYPFANNANSAIKRSLWEKHPFEEGFQGLEDIEWADYWMDKGMKVLYEPKSCIIHVHTESWAQVRRRYHREGIAARWVGTKIHRHIPLEIWRELRWGVHDLWLAAKAGRLGALAGKIYRFRHEKLVGTVGGIIGSKRMSNPRFREELYFQTRFPAVVIHGPSRAKLDERKAPGLKPGDVLVRVSHVGVCGTDLEILDGTLGYYRSGRAEYPIVPGHELSGTIVDLGPRVEEFKEGDHVVVECIQGCGECRECNRDEAVRCQDRSEVGVMGKDGGYAGYMVTRARYVHRIPEQVSLAQAALTEPLAVVIKGLRRLGSQPQGDSPRSCAVVGAGTIGYLAAQVLTLRGHPVTIIDREPRRLALINGKYETSRTLDGADRFEWIVEATGSQSALDTILQRSGTGATLLLLGLPYASKSISFESVVSFDRALIGSIGSSGADFEEALRTLPDIDTTPFLQALYPLAEFEKAWAVSRDKSVLKAMLQVDEGEA